MSFGVDFPMLFSRRCEFPKYGTSTFYKCDAMHIYKPTESEAVEMRYYNNTTLFPRLGYLYTLMTTNYLTINLFKDVKDDISKYNI